MINRLIKFRARTLDSDTKDGWVYSTDHGLSDFWLGVEEGRYDDETVGQYTGLKDKNGTPIFENDIVEHYGEVFEVVFDEGAFLINGISTRINPDGSEYVVRGDLLMNQDDVLVVIGNIYEGKGGKQ